MPRSLLALTLAAPPLLASACGGGDPANAAVAPVVGTWQGINGTSGQIQIAPSGTYSYSVGGGTGTVSPDGDKWAFSGTLAPWGDATLSNGVLIFYAPVDGWSVEMDFEKL